jgi:hypothetical protein
VKGEGPRPNGGGKEGGRRGVAQCEEGGVLMQKGGRGEARGRGGGGGGVTPQCEGVGVLMPKGEGVQEERGGTMILCFAGPKK